MFGDGKIINDN